MSSDTQIEVSSSSSSSGTEEAGPTFSSPIQQIKGRSFALTGKLKKKREEWKRLILERGGTYSESVSKRTSYLIAPKDDTESTKVLKAHDFLVPVHDEEWMGDLVQACPIVEPSQTTPVDSPANKKRKQEEHEEFVPLKEGESRPVGDQTVTLRDAIYSCTCNAWISQKKLPSVKTCKHIKKLTGNKHLESSDGAPKRTKLAKVEKPGLMMPEKLSDGFDPKGWLMSNNKKGVRCVWNGTSLISRLGDLFDAPSWFLDTFPKETSLDGELYTEEDLDLISIIKSANISSEVSEKWRHVRYCAFDIFGESKSIEERAGVLTQLAAVHTSPHISFAQYRVCEGIEDLMKYVDEVHERSTEIGVASAASSSVSDVSSSDEDDEDDDKYAGYVVYLREKGSTYCAKRSKSMRKVGPFHTLHAKVTSHIEGKTKLKGKTVAIVVGFEHNQENIETKVSIGLTDQEYTTPPVVGTIVKIRFQEVSKKNVVRFPVFVRESSGGVLMMTTTMTTTTEQGLTSNNDAMLTQ